MEGSGDAQRREMLRYANDSDRRFLRQLADDIHEFCELYQDCSILIFPKLHTHYGYLIHTVAETFGLVSMALGKGDYRVTIICNKFLLLPRRYTEEDLFDRILQPKVRPSGPKVQPLKLELLPKDPDKPEDPKKPIEQDKPEKQAEPVKEAEPEKQAELKKQEKQEEQDKPEELEKQEEQDKPEELEKQAEQDKPEDLEKQAEQDKTEEPEKQGEQDKPEEREKQVEQDGPDEREKAKEDDKPEKLEEQGKPEEQENREEQEQQDKLEEQQKQEPEEQDKPEVQPIPEEQHTPEDPDKPDAQNPKEQQKSDKEPRMIQNVIQMDQCFAIQVLKDKETDITDIIKQLEETPSNDPHQPTCERFIITVSDNSNDSDDIEAEVPVVQRPKLVAKSRRRQRSSVELPTIVEHIVQLSPQTFGTREDFKFAAMHKSEGATVLQSAAYNKIPGCSTGFDNDQSTQKSGNSSDENTSAEDVEDWIPAPLIIADLPILNEESALIAADDVTPTKIIPASSWDISSWDLNLSLISPNISPYKVEEKPTSESKRKYVKRPTKLTRRKQTKGRALFDCKVQNEAQSEISNALSEKYKEVFITRDKDGIRQCLDVKTEAPISTNSEVPWNNDDFKILFPMEPESTYSGMKFSTAQCIKPYSLDMENETSTNSEVQCNNDACRKLFPLEPESTYSGMKFSTAQCIKPYSLNMETEAQTSTNAEVQCDNDIFRKLFPLAPASNFAGLRLAIMKCIPPHSLHMDLEAETSTNSEVQYNNEDLKKLLPMEPESTYSGMKFSTEQCIKPDSLDMESEAQTSTNSEVPCNNEDLKQRLPIKPELTGVNDTFVLPEGIEIDFETLFEFECKSDTDIVVTDNQQCLYHINELILVDNNYQPANCDVGSEEKIQIEPSTTEAIGAVVLPIHELEFDNIVEVQYVTSDNQVETNSDCLSETNNINQPDNRGLQTLEQTFSVAQSASGATENSLFVFSAGEELNIGDIVEIQYHVPTDEESENLNFTESVNVQVLEVTNQEFYIQQDNRDMETKEQSPTVLINEFDKTSTSELLATMEPGTNEVIGTSENIVIESLDNGQEETTYAYLLFSKNNATESPCSDLDSVISSDSSYRDATICDTNEHDTIQRNVCLSASLSVEKAPIVAENYLSSDKSCSISEEIDVEDCTSIEENETMQSIASLNTISSDEDEDFQDALQMDSDSCTDVSIESSYEDAVESLSDDNASYIKLYNNKDNISFDLAESFADKLIIDDQIPHRQIDPICDLPVNLLEADDISEGDNNSQINISLITNCGAERIAVLVDDSPEFVPNTEELFDFADTSEQSDSGMTIGNYSDSSSITSFSSCSSYESKMPNKENVKRWLRLLSPGLMQRNAEEDDGVIDYIDHTIMDELEAMESKNKEDRVVTVDVLNMAQTFAEDIMNKAFEALALNVINKSVPKVEHLKDNVNIMTHQQINDEFVDVDLSHVGHTLPGSTNNDVDFIEDHQHVTETVDNVMEDQTTAQNVNCGSCVELAQFDIQKEDMAETKCSKEHVHNDLAPKQIIENLAIAIDMAQPDVEKQPSNMNEVELGSQYDLQSDQSMDHVQQMLQYTSPQYLDMAPVQNRKQQFIAGDSFLQMTYHGIQPETQIQANYDSLAMLDIQPYGNGGQVLSGIVNETYPVIDPVLSIIEDPIPLPLKQDSIQYMDEVVGMVQTIIDGSDDSEYVKHDWLNWKNDSIYLQLESCLGEIRVTPVSDEFVISISAIIKNGGLVQQATCMFYLTVRAQIERFKENDSDISVLTFPKFNQMHCYIIFRIAEMFTLAGYIIGDGAFRTILLCKRNFWHSPVGPVASQQVQAEIELQMQAYCDVPLNERVKAILGDISMLEVTQIFKEYLQMNRLESFDDEGTPELIHFLKEQVTDFLIDPRRPRVLLLPNANDYQRFVCFELAGRFQLAVTTIGPNDMIIYDPLNCRPAIMTLTIEGRYRKLHTEANALRIDADEFVPEPKSPVASNAPSVCSTTTRSYRRPSGLFLARYREDYFGPQRDFECDYYYVELINELIWQLCRYENVMDQIFDLVGDDLQFVTVEQHNYYEFDDGASFMTHIVEMYDFPVAFVTRDLVRIINNYRIGHFRIKWVHDTSALIVFDSVGRAYELLGCRHRDAKFRPFDHACPEAKRIAASVPEIYSTSFVKENTSIQWRRY